MFTNEQIRKAALQAHAEKRLTAQAEEHIGRSCLLRGIVPNTCCAIGAAMSDADVECVGTSNGSVDELEYKYGFQFENMEYAYLVQVLHDVWCTAGTEDARRKHEAEFLRALTEPVPSVEYCIDRRRKLLSGQGG